MEETTIMIDAAKKAGALLMEGFNKVHSIEYKDSREIVTEADKAADKAILDILKSEYPDYAVLSEESGAHGSGDKMWIVDPLDGTTNYSIKNPFFNVSIALAEKIGERWQVVSGVVYAPFTDEMFFAEKGEGAFKNGEMISVSKEDDLAKQLIAFCHGHSPESINRTLKMFSIVKPVVRDFNRMRAAALELAYVADGRIGAFVSPDGRPWDAAAGSLLVKEAGGQISDFKGNPWDVEGEKRDILASNGVLHQKLLEMVSLV